MVTLFLNILIKRKIIFILPLEVLARPLSENRYHDRTVEKEFGKNVDDQSVHVFGLL